MTEPQYAGLILIGDPHLDGRIPGFRKDNYPEVILEKLRWSLDYAEEHRLLPAILGDLFDKPRDNPNWLLASLLGMLRAREVIGLYGNHDVQHNPELTAHDSLRILVEAGVIRLVSEESPWRGRMNGRNVIVGGSSYRQEIPKSFARGDDKSTYVIWLTHHDILIPGYEEGRHRPTEIEGIDLVVNGHIHRRLDTVSRGRTAWMTPGNISRRSRSDASRAHVPSVLRIDVFPGEVALNYVTVPHRPFDEVFHDAIVETVVEDRPSAFVEGLAELQARRTASGAGLLEFIDHNLKQFEPEVAAEIRRLAMEVTK